MQIEHKTEKGTLLFRMIPDDGNLFNTGITANNPTPDGFEFINITSEVTEEQAKMMVDSIDFTDFFKHYTNPELWSCSAIGSFKSLMQHLEVYEVNPYDGYNRTNFYTNKEEIEYYKAQSRTGKWIVLFKK